MINFLLGFSPAMQALIAGIFTWLCTALGAASSLIMPDRGNKKFTSCMLGFASGVMIAASFWSLLAPAIAMSESLPLPSWLPPVIGFLAGGLFLLLLDKFLPHIHPNSETDEPEGVKTSWKRSILLVSAITIHNIPEGLAVGVAFGAASLGLPEASLSAAIALAAGIGIQNFPEGAAVSAPLRATGMSRWKSFMVGQFSGLVEPIAAVLGALLVVLAKPILPYALSFAAGAMIYVVIEELIPEAHENSGGSDWAVISAIAGFAVMMILDVALG